jgi:hypothetical protein
VADASTKDAAHAGAPVLDAALDASPRSCSALAGLPPASGPPRCTRTAYVGDFDPESPKSTVVVPAHGEGTADALLGASREGCTFLEIVAGCQDGSAVWLFDRDPDSGAYVGADATSSLSGLDLRFGHVTLAPDGVTVVANLAGATGFAIRRRTSPGSSTFDAVDATAFTEVNAFCADGALATPYHPVLSVDGRTFFFHTGAVTYEARRDAPVEPFGRPVALAELDGHEVSSVSSDRLTVFTSVGYSSYVWARPNLDAPFDRLSNSYFPGFDVVPLDDDCSRLMGTGPSGACTPQGIALLYASP